MSTPNQVKLFIKPFCGWCHEAIDWLDAKGIQYETLDVITNRAAMIEMVEKSGQTLAPVIEIDGAILADFDVNELAQFWAEQTADQKN
ncbi:MAG: Glutaredoxin 3 [Verrucomicrobia subdivision 3 bacterium]|nr:Glutaredoxin 3 [Limisphaerales bacterium]MCS1417377.1 Glutaredoxin 3 [Limisphaerales bacterium]